MTPIMLVMAGLVLLVVGGELLVRGAVRTAKQFGVSELLIGLTLVGFATSFPELVTSVQASMQGSPGIAIGNFVGSNISNILLILGLAAMLYPIEVDSKCLKRDGYFVFALAVGFAATSIYLPYNALLGMAFIVILLLYVAVAIYHETRDEWLGHTSAFEKGRAHQHLRAKATPTPAADEPHTESSAPPARRNGMAIGASIAIAIVGLITVTIGGYLLVDGATALARSSGVPEETIGLTIVAIGTSLPEFVTSLVAALRGFSSIALGNILGSNIYNTLGIGGITAIIAPTAIPAQIQYYDNFVVIAASLAFLAFAALDLRIRRREGFVLVCAYLAYLVSLLPASQTAWAVQAAKAFF